MKFCIVIPTRGIVFARTVQTMLRMPAQSPIVIVDGLPIPDSHNECIRKALKTDCTHIWFLEEDMELTDRGIAAMTMAAQTHPIVAMNYKITPTVYAVQYDHDKPLFAGFGCTIFERKIFEKDFTQPWLTDEYDVNILGTNPFRYKSVRRTIERPVYGKFDVYFFIQCMEKNIPLYILPDFEATHLRMKSWERKMVNNGTHDIYEL